LRAGQENRKRQKKPGGEFHLQPSDGVALLARLVVGGILIVAAAAKLRAGRADFFRRVYAYDLLPARASWTLARALPSVELGVGVLLVLGLIASVASAAAALLLLTFSAAVSISLLRGRDQQCGCGGDLRPVSWRLVGRNACLVLISVALLRAGPGLASLDRAFDWSPFTNPFALALAATVFLGSVWLGALDRARVPARTSADRTKFGEAAHV
jgi:putative oxidoreductase